MSALVLSSKIYIYIYTRMRVSVDGNPHEGSQCCTPASHPWWGGGTTWCTTYPHHLRGAVNRARRANRDVSRLTRGNLNTRWALGSSIREGGGDPGFIVYVHM